MSKKDPTNIPHTNHEGVKQQLTLHWDLNLQTLNIAQAFPNEQPLQSCQRDYRLCESSKSS